MLAPPPWTAGHLAALLVWTGVRIAGATGLPNMVIASLNVGGDGPQPEYLGGDWQKSYGFVEEAFGAKVIFLSNVDAEPCKLKEKYRERYRGAFRSYCNVPYLTKHDTFGASEMTALGRELRQVKVTDYVMEKMMIHFRNKESMKEQINKKIGGHTTLVNFARYLMSGTNPPGEDKAADALMYVGLSDLDKDKECKYRKVFPYFSKGFMEMYAMLYQGKAGQPFEAYWKSMMAVDGKTCKYVEDASGAAQLDYIPLMVFDLLVLRTFHEAVQSSFLKRMDPMEYVIDNKLKHRKQALVHRILQKVNILFLQEAEDALVASGSPETLIGVEAPKATSARLYGDEIAEHKVKVKGKIDAAIMLKDFKFTQTAVEPVTVTQDGTSGAQVVGTGRNGSTVVDAVSPETQVMVMKARWASRAQGAMQPEAHAVQSYDSAYHSQISPEALQKEWMAYAADMWKTRFKKNADFTVTIDPSDVHLYPGGKLFNLETKVKEIGGVPKEVFNEAIHDVSATAAAVAQVGAKHVLLMSMHPKSNGRPCVLFAYMAKEFFEWKKASLGLHSMLLGMDANVLTLEDKEEKKNKPAKNGFSWPEFKGKVEDMGFGVIFDPAKITVWKQRTFLQTQISKAAKVDMAIKDIMLQYPKSSLALQTVEVVNVELEANEAPWWNLVEHAKHCALNINYRASRVFNSEFGYYGGSPFPTVNWPLDHFMTVAAHNRVKKYEAITTGTKRKEEESLIDKIVEVPKTVAGAIVETPKAVYDYVKDGTKSAVEAAEDVIKTVVETPKAVYDYVTDGTKSAVEAAEDVIKTVVETPKAVYDYVTDGTESAGDRD